MTHHGRNAGALAILMIALALTSGTAARAADADAAKTTGAQAPAAAAPTETKEVAATVPLTAEEIAERDARKACKVAICGAFRNKSADGGDISCGVIKSWRKEQLTKLISKLKVTWPYGDVRCTSTVKLKRADLVKAMSDEKFESTIDKHEVSCAVERERDGPADIKFDFAPKVTFEGGKATKASMNWGKIDAPTLVKGALWTATAADNTVNLLSGTLVEDINDFISKKCDEVKSEWASSK
ncbi:MAG: hypothetical protein ACRCS9_03145 [Hyphomicrobium sp.]